MALPISRSTGTPQTALQRSQRRGDPFQAMEDVYDRMGQLVQGFFGESGQPGLAGGRWTALADIEETDDAFIVEIDLPGVKPADLNLELRDNELRISGEIKEKERVGVLRRQTRQVGQFDYVIALAADIDPDKVDASLSDGVLTVRLGKATGSQPRRIEIKS
jgi:HSP20 family protein